MVRDRVAQPVEVPGVTGQDVRAVLLSRDGTRLVAEVAREGADAIVVARVQRDGAGRVRRVAGSRELPLRGLDADTIVDVAFVAPTSLAVLTAPTEETAQVLVLSVDGSTSPDEAATAAELFRGEVDDLVTSPAPGAPLYVRTPGGMIFALASNGRWISAGIREGLRAPTFVG